MKPHVRNYFKAFGYDEASVILCEVCHRVSSDLHHIEPRSSFGSTRKVEQNMPSNLIALCRRCHDLAHGPESGEYKLLFQNIVNNRK